MEALLVLILIAAATAKEYSFFPDNSALGSSSKSIDFLKGFLDKIGEAKSIDDLLRCVKNIENTIAKIMEACELIKKMTIDNIVKGITILLAAVQEFINMIKPCSTGYTILEKLYHGIINTDYANLIKKIERNLPDIFSYITSAVYYFANQNCNCTGKQVGLLMKLFFLDTLFIEETEQEIIELLKGFFEGLGATIDVNPLLKCIKDIENFMMSLRVLLMHS